jgi:hypothetical protein
LGVSTSIAVLTLATIFILPAKAEPLSSSDVVSKVIGHTLTWTAEDGPQRGEIIFAEDGSVEMTTTLPGLPRDLGTWRLRAGELCTRWQAARQGVEKCYRIEEAGPGRFRSSGGNIFEIKQPLV